MNTKNRIFSLLLILLEILLILTIFLLGIRIKEMYRENVKGIQFATLIKKDDIVFDSIKNKLKYFYEPKPNHIEIRNPDWLGYEVKNTINEDSLNERYNYSTEKRSDTYRIITLGDSFTFGQYVSTQDSYPEFLEDLLNNKLKCSQTKKFEVINLGVYGYDIEYTVNRFIKRGIKYNPDLVIWLINNWNFSKINEYYLPLEEKFIKEGIPTLDTSTGIYVAGEKAIKEILNQFGEKSLLGYQRNILNKFEQYYTNNLLIVSQHLSDDYKEVIKNFISGKQNYSFYDKLFNTGNNKIYHLLDYHPNKEGHRRIAIDILEYLLGKNYLGDCRYD